MKFFKKSKNFPGFSKFSINFLKIFANISQIFTKFSFNFFKIV